MKPTFLVLFLLFSLFSCKELSNEQIKEENTTITAKLACVGTLKQIFRAIEQKNIENIRAVLPTDEEVEFIMPNSNLQNKDDLLLFYKSLFSRNGWSMNSDIISSEIGQEFAIFTVKQTYKEVERNNKPYTHEMLVTYVLQNKKRRWVLRQHHASTVHKK